MFAAVGFWVGGSFAAVCVQLPGLAQILFERRLPVVFVDEVFAGVIRRVDVNGFDFAVVGFLKQFQGFQIIAFNEQVFGMYGCSRDCRAQSRGGRRLNDFQAFRLPRPTQSVAHPRLVGGFGELAERGLDAFPVDGLRFIEGFGEEPLELAPFFLSRNGGF